VITPEDLKAMGPMRASIIEILSEKEGLNVAKMLSGDKSGIDKVLEVLYENLHIRYLKIEVEDVVNDRRRLKIEIDCLGAKDD
jgi:hypothetical protein